MLNYIYISCVFIGASSMETKTVVDNNDIIECPVDDKPTIDTSELQTGKFSMCHLQSQLSEIIL